jgi:hypothetical protein
MNSIHRLLSRRTLAALLASLGAGLVSSADTIYGLGAGGFIFTFDSASPGTATAPVAVTGLGGSTLVGIDIRPADGRLYGVGTGNKVFTINPVTGVASDVTASSFLGTAVGGGLGSGSNFGVDFNPVANRLRIVSDADTNLRVFGPSETVDPLLRYQTGDANFGANPNVTSVAYTNPDTDVGTGTTLYGLDTTLDILVRHNTGPGFQNLETIGSLGVDFSSASGFDLNVAGTAYGAFHDSAEDVSRLYRINLGTGAASLVGDIGSTQHLLDIAVTPVPEQGAYSAIAGGLLVAFAAWRRVR